ncbi:hypothetical protein GEMRC1_005805 [Eukaryota sp. GEM-RC1]
MKCCLLVLSVLRVNHVPVLDHLNLFIYNIFDKSDLLFEGKNRDHQWVLVKFVQGRYGVDVHNYLAQLGYAPRLLDTLPCGDWIVVVMERLYVVDGFDSVILKADLELISKAKKSFNKAVKAMHEHDPPCVHGDLRPNSILVRNDGTIAIIDFD